MVTVIAIALMTIESIKAIMITTTKTTTHIMINDKHDYVGEKRIGKQNINSADLYVISQIKVIKITIIMVIIVTKVIVQITVFITTVTMMLI